jgi:hypothetical protein
MLRCILIAFTMITPAVFAQAPIERHTPPTPTGISAWPTPDSIKPRSHLLISTTGYAEQWTCRLQRIEADRIVCAGEHHSPSVIFDRNSIAMITDVPRASSHIGYGFVKASLVAIAVGLGCVVLGGGTVCGVISTIGLVGSLGGTFVISLINDFSTFHGEHRPRPIYIAPQPAFGA